MNRIPGHARSEQEQLPHSLPTVVMSVDFPFPGATGSPLHCQAIAAGLVAHGSPTTVVKYVARSESETSRSLWNGIPVVRIARRRRWRTLLSVVRAAPDSKLYAHGDLSAALLAPYRLLLRLPLTVEIHSVFGVQQRQGRTQQLRAKIQGAIPRLVRAAVIVLSHSERDELLRRGFNPRDVHVLYPPIDVEAYRCTPRGVRRDQPAILYVGNFHAYQGVDMLLEAFASVAAAHPTVRLHIAGGTERDLPDGGAAIAPAARDRISFLGRVAPDETRALYEAADILVIPRPDLPINRTTGRKLGEYLAAGRTIVATDVADHQRLLDANRAGIVCGTSVEALANALLRALGEESPTLEMATNAQLLAQREFSLDEGIRRRQQILVHQVDRSSGTRAHDSARAVG